VKFTVNFVNLAEQEKSSDFFVVEIASRKVFPHSVFTFLALVESQFYHGIDFAISEEEDDSVLEIGTNDDSFQQKKQKMDALGLSGGSALSFYETSSNYPCRAGSNSFGFVERGPGLRLHLSSDNPPTNDGSRSCFGEVVRGQEVLQSIYETIQEAATVVRLNSVTVLLPEEEL
jgi:cyclophilin family peptidyl-prolyl cis-trans isomerase